jgi:hypothetical protein
MPPQRPLLIPITSVEGTAVARRWTVLLLFCVTLLIRIVALGNFTESDTFVPAGDDMKFYNDWALRILKGGWTDGKAFYGLPGYAFLLAGIYQAFGYNLFFPGLLQSVAESITVVLVFKIGERTFQRSGALGMIAAALAAAGYAAFLPAVTYSIVLMPTALAVTAFWCCVWLVISAEPKWTWHPWVPLGLLVGLVATAVATILFALPLALGKAWIHSRGMAALHRLRNLAAASALIGVGVLAGTAPCWIHNYFIAKDPVLLSAHSGLNFYVGNNPLSNGYPQMPSGMRAGQHGMLKDSITIPEHITGRALKYSEVSAFWSRKAVAYIMEDPARWFRLLGTKVRNLWSAYQYDDLSIITLLRKSCVTLPGLKFGLVAALAIPGAFFGLRYSHSWIILAGTLLHMAALLPVFVTERYRLAAVPGLLLFAAIGLTDAWNSLVRHRWWEALIYAGIAATGATLVSSPQPKVELWALDDYNFGIEALRLDKPDLAAPALILAYRYSPENSEINFALGNLQLARGDTSKAQLCYLRALALNPHHDGAWNNLGVIAMKNGEWQVAEECLRRSIAREPDDEGAHYILAQCQLNQGKRDDALRSIDQALRLSPTREEFLRLREQILQQSEQQQQE